MEFNRILLYCSDLEKSKDFYQKLGFIIEEKDGSHFLAVAGGLVLDCYDQSALHFQQDASRPKGAGLFIYMLADDVDEAHKDFVGKGLAPSGEPKDWPWGNREFAIKDPDGYRFVFYKPLK